MDSTPSTTHATEPVTIILIIKHHPEALQVVAAACSGCRPRCPQPIPAPTSAPTTTRSTIPQDYITSPRAPTEPAAALGAQEHSPLPPGWVRLGSTTRGKATVKTYRGVPVDVLINGNSEILPSSLTSWLLDDARAEGCLSERCCDRWAEQSAHTVLCVQTQGLYIPPGVYSTVGFQQPPQ